MKRIVSLLFSLVMVVSIFTTLPVTASAASKKDLTFEEDYYGSDAYIVTDCKTSASGELVIPDTYKSKPVIRIEPYAFENCKKLTSVTVGKKVEEISYNAFYNCTKLAKITVPASVEYIDSSAFYNCSGLKSISVSSKNKYYSSSKGVLFNKKKTELLTYPMKKTSTSYTVPSTVKTIIYYAFKDNKNLKSVTIPDSVKSLDYYVFDGCSKLATLKIGKGITDFSYRSIGECKSLKTISFSKNNKYYSSSNGVVFNKKKTSIVMFPMGKSGDPYKIPSTVKSIGVEAFTDCTKLKSVKIPSSVKKIDESAFYGCTNLKSVTMPNSVKEIGSCAFSECKNLKKVTFSNKVTDIAYGAFSGCASLSKVSIPNSVKSLGYNSFSGCKKLTSVSIGKGIKNIQWGTFEGCKSLKSIVIPHTIKTIDGSAFENCSNLKTIRIPYTVEEIGNNAFGYTFSYKTYEYKKIKGVKIYGKKGSAAQKYAKDNKFTFVAVSKPGKTKLKSIDNASTGIKITWKEVKKAEYYEIYRKVKGGDYKYIGRTSKEYFTDTTAKSGKKYYYKVRSVNVAGKSDFTSAKSILFLDNPVMKTPKSTKKGVTLKWSKVTGAEGYIIYRKTGSGSYKKLAKEKGVSNLDYRDKKAKKGKTYTYKVKAYKNFTYSAYSNAKKIKDKY